MLKLRNKDGDVKRVYECTFEASMELCMANIECLLKIALADSDEHIERMGGEAHLLDLMNGYLELYDNLKVRKMLTELEELGECEDCKHNEEGWDSESCDGCSKAHSNYEPQTDCDHKCIQTEIGCELTDCQWMR